jgi:hypothetical protein
VFQLSRLWLTAERAERLAADVAAVLDRYRDDGRPDEGAARFAVSFVAVPAGAEAGA